MHLQDHIQIIGKIDSKGKMTCGKIMQKSGPNILATFIQIGNIVYSPGEVDMLVFKIERVVQFSWVAECDEFANAQEEIICPCKTVSNQRIPLISCVESTLPVDGVTKGRFFLSST